MSGDLYPERIWKMFRQPRRAGVFPPKQGARVGRAGTPAGAALLELQLLLSAEERIEDARFRALGCPWLIATGSWLCGHLIGRRFEDGGGLEPAQVAEQLSLPAVKRYCAVMACEALADALQTSESEDV